MSQIKLQEADVRSRVKLHDLGTLIGDRAILGLSSMRCGAVYNGQRHRDVSAYHQVSEYELSKLMGFDDNPHLSYSEIAKTIDDCLETFRYVPGVTSDTVTHNLRRMFPCQRPTLTHVIPQVSTSPGCISRWVVCTFPLPPEPVQHLDVPAHDDDWLDLATDRRICDDTWRTESPTTGRNWWHYARDMEEYDYKFGVVVRSNNRRFEPKVVFVKDTQIEVIPLEISRAILLASWRPALSEKWHATNKLKEMRRAATFWKVPALSESLDMILNAAISEKLAVRTSGATVLDKLCLVHKTGHMPDLVSHASFALISDLIWNHWITPLVIRHINRTGSEHLRRMLGTTGQENAAILSLYKCMRNVAGHRFGMSITRRHTSLAMLNKLEEFCAKNS